MPSQQMKDLIPGVSDADVEDDTGEDTIQLDPAQNPNAAQARMFTLQQLHDLFNVKLRRSDVRHRLDANDKATRVLEQKVDDLEKWRIDLEERIQKRSKEVDEWLDHKQDQINACKKEYRENFATCQDNHHLNN